MRHERITVLVSLVILIALGPVEGKSKSEGKAGNKTLPVKGYELVWSDEFESDELDFKKWDYRGLGPRRDAVNVKDTISLDGKGHLVLTTKRVGDKYHSAMISTQDKYETAFGYFECRVKLQTQIGHWSAFWLMGDGVKPGNSGREGTEVDIMEKPWLDDRVQNTLHWGGYGKEHKSAGNVAKVPGVMDGFHTFSLLWTSEEYVFYTDGKETWRSKAGGVCQAPLFIKLSDEAQMKGWAGDLLKASLPDQFLVDYVRVYDLVDQK